MVENIEQHRKNGNQIRGSTTILEYPICPPDEFLWSINYDETTIWYGGDKLLLRKISEIRKRAQEQKSHHQRTMEASGDNIYFVYN